MSLKMTINEAKVRLENGDLSRQSLETLRNDERKGIQKLLKQYDRNKERALEMKRKFNEMRMFEEKQYQTGKRSIAGIDEAGRGPLAGPVVAGAVILHKDFYLPGLNDSKQLTLEKREAFFDVIREEAISYSVGIVSNAEIDEINIYRATKLAMQRAIEGLTNKPDHLLIDAMELSGFDCTQESLIKGDARSVSIAAASVLAKVTRDRMMKELHQEYPVYDFKNNQGYGTKAHLDALEKYGPTKYHRVTFAPVSTMISS
ncbi:ribonuclease HII [Thalassobacillus hwangdonensis]|uniref:Ribonuclease HII n=1 Tax=Thalassobacillus hwangdonensis TaxID=546108 RepID=A0ABW3KWA7_9BACI